MDNEEIYLQDMLATLHKSYMKVAQPYIDKLVEIRSMKQPAPIVVTVEQAKMLGLIPNE